MDETARCDETSAEMNEELGCKRNHPTFKLLIAKRIKSSDLAKFVSNPVRQ